MKCGDYISFLSLIYLKKFYISSLAFDIGVRATQNTTHDYINIVNHNYDCNDRVRTYFISCWCFQR